MKFLVIIPTYNENANISTVLNKVLNLESESQIDIESSIDPENPQDIDTPHVEVDIKVDGVSVKDSKKQD